MILDTINFKSTIKFRVNCGWDSNPYHQTWVLIEIIKYLILYFQFHSSGKFELSKIDSSIYLIVFFLISISFFTLSKCIGFSKNLSILRSKNLSL